MKEISIAFDVGLLNVSHFLLNFGWFHPGLLKKGALFKAMFFLEQNGFYLTSFYVMGAGIDDDDVLLGWESVIRDVVPSVRLPMRIGNGFILIKN